ncbi:unnamed protein product, partial [Amoebophrya sp. A120]
NLSSAGGPDLLQDAGCTDSLANTVATLQPSANNPSPLASPRGTFTIREGGGTADEDHFDDDFYNEDQHFQAFDDALAKRNTNINAQP